MQRSQYLPSGAAPVSPSQGSRSNQDHLTRSLEEIKDSYLHQIVSMRDHVFREDGLIRREKPRHEGRLTKQEENEVLLSNSINATGSINRFAHLTR